MAGITVTINVSNNNKKEYSGLFMKSNKVY